MVIITLNSYKKLQVKRFWLTCWRVRASVEEIRGMGCPWWLIPVEQVHSSVPVPHHSGAGSQGSGSEKKMPIWKRGGTKRALPVLASFLSGFHGWSCGALVELGSLSPLSAHQWYYLSCPSPVPSSPGPQQRCSGEVLLQPMFVTVKINRFSINWWLTFKNISRMHK